MFTFNPLIWMRGNAIPVRGFIASHFLSSAGGTAESPVTETYMDLQRATADVVQEVAKSQSAAVFVPSKNLCGENSCRFLDSLGPLYGDSQHVTALGSFEALGGLVLSQGTAYSGGQKHPY